jgi:hypothetical protein
MPQGLEFKRDMSLRMMSVTMKLWLKRKIDGITSLWSIDC